MITDSLLPDEIMALTLYGEARGESIQGQIAVANVIMNRWRGNIKKYKTVKDVCLEPAQFSCWNASDPNRAKLDALAADIQSGKLMKQPFAQCLYIARGALGFNLLDNTDGNIHYMTNVLFNSDKRPDWATNAKNLVVIDNHTFFNV